LVGIYTPYKNISAMDVWAIGLSIPHFKKIVGLSYFRN